MNATSLLRKRATRFAIVLLIAVALIVLAPKVADSVFPYFFPLVLVPITALLLLIPPVIGLALVALSNTRLVLSAFLLLVIAQAIILIAWWFGFTAESAFNAWSQDELLATGWPILDPGLESILIKGFWMGAAIILALTIESSVIRRLVSPGLSAGNNSPANLVFLLFFEALILLCLHFSSVNFRRLPEREVVSSVSASANREMRLVPMNAMIDTNGIVMQRKPGAFVWRTVAGVGDLLSQSESERFVWTDNDSKAYLLFQINDRELPMAGFDFMRNERIDPRTYRAAP